MTATYYCSRKAGDLRIGNMFVDWAFPTDGVYGRPMQDHQHQDSGPGHR